MRNQAGGRLRTWFVGAAWQSLSCFHDAASSGRAAAPAPRPLANADLTRLRSARVDPSGDLAFAPSNGSLGEWHGCREVSFSDEAPPRGAAQTSALADLGVTKDAICRALRLPSCKLFGSGLLHRALLVSGAVLRMQDFSRCQCRAGSEIQSLVITDELTCDLLFQHHPCVGSRGWPVGPMRDWVPPVPSRDGSGAALA